MKKNIKKSILLLCISFVAYSQKDSIKNEHFKLPQFSRTELLWLNKNGFDYPSYNWKNKEVNEHIQKGMQYKKRSDNYLFLSGAVGFLTWSPYLYYGIKYITADDHGSGSLSGGPIKVLIGSIIILGGVIVGSVGVGSMAGFLNTPNKYASQLYISDANALLRNIKRTPPPKKLRKYGDLYWLQTNNFDIQNYKWDSEEINKNLLLSIKNKRAADIIVSSSLGIAALSFAILPFMIDYTNQTDIGKTDEEMRASFNKYIAPFLIVGIAVPLASVYPTIILRYLSKRKLEQAIILQSYNIGK